MSTHQKKTVDQWLSEVNYHDYSSYVPSTFALEMVNLIKLINGEEGEENKTPVVHMMMLDNFVSDEVDVVNMCHRGLGKSTLLEYLIFYIAIYEGLPNLGDVGLMLYVSDSIENGVKTMRKSLEYRWQNSDFLQKWLPEARFTDVRWDFTNLAGHKLTVKGYGARTGIRGARESGQRPVVALLDDLLSDEDARSPTIIASIEDTIYKAVDYALHPTRRKVIWAGTPFNQNDPLYKAVESGAWAVNVYPVAERWYDGITKEEFYSSWPDRFTYESVKAQYEKSKATGNVAGFYQELMLEINSEDDRLIEDRDIQWYSGRDIERYRDEYNWYITTDFATSSKSAADFSVISVWAYNNAGQWMLNDGVLRKTTMDRTVDALFDLVVRYNVKQVGIETNGQQRAFVDWIRKEMAARRVYFRIIEVRRTSDKVSSFHTVVPLFKRGEILFNKDLLGSALMTEALNELKRATAAGFKSAHDDFLDTVSMLPHLNAWRPSVSSRRRAGSEIYDDEETEDEAAMVSYIV